MILCGTQVPLALICAEPMPPASLLALSLTVGSEETFGERLESDALFRHDLAVVEIALRPGSRLFRRNIVRTLACPDKDVCALRSRCLPMRKRGSSIELSIDM